MQAISAAQAELSLAIAFEALASHVSSTTDASTSGSASVLPAGPAPEFSYLLTQKQFDEINRICVAENWPTITCRGIHIDAVAMAHPLESRNAKDSCSAADTCLIIKRSFSPRSVVRINRNRKDQAIFLNTQQKFAMTGGAFYAMAVVVLRRDGDRCFLVPVTAYRCTEAKMRAINKNTR